MNKSEKDTKKKALDLMIVLGGKPKDKPEEDDYSEKENGGEDECKCSCCGMPCPNCAKDGEESEDDMSEDEDD
jgi:hypothetical protein